MSVFIFVSPLLSLFSLLACLYLFCRSGNTFFKVKFVGLMYCNVKLPLRMLASNMSNSSNLCLFTSDKKSLLKHLEKSTKMLQILSSLLPRWENQTEILAPSSAWPSPICYSYLLCESSKWEISPNCLHFLSPCLYQENKYILKNNKM